MDPTDNPENAKTPTQATGTNKDTVTAATGAAPDRPFGPDGATILATEHWSLLGTRSLIWNEAMSRTTVFLTVLSASIVALTLLADATGFGRRTTTVAWSCCPWCSCSGWRPTAAWSRSIARTWPSPWP